MLSPHGGADFHHSVLDRREYRATIGWKCRRCRLLTNHEVEEEVMS